MLCEIQVQSDFGLAGVPAPELWCLLLPCRRAHHAADGLCAPEGANCSVSSQTPESSTKSPTTIDRQWLCSAASHGSDSKFVPPRSGQPASPRRAVAVRGLYW